MTSLIDRLPAAAPRYTSYPSSPHFSEEVGGRHVQEWIRALRPGSSLSLYLHIPFCDTLCWFCGCHTKATRRYEPVVHYLKALKAEIAIVAKLVPADVRVTHIHFGGGSPTMLTGPDFLHLVNAVKKHFEVSPDAEIALETDPRDLEEDRLDAMAKAGVTRVSMGIQDFHPEVQKAINRYQSEELTRWAVEECRARGIRSVNLDLVYGLPLQTLDRLMSTVDQSLAMKPDRMALFGYAHVPWMKKHMKMIDETTLADAPTRKIMAERSTAHIITAGYKRIGLDHFARPEDSMAIAAETGKLHRNFQGYTTDEAEALIGLGASAVSNFPQGFAQNDGASNRYAVAIHSGRLATARGLERTQEDVVRGAAIEMLMCTFKLDPLAMRRRFGQRAEGVLREIERVTGEDDGTLIALEGGEYRLSDRGRLHVRQICALLDPYFQTGTARHSAAV
ncbi:MAG: oxygen-independent coproporphyrinogen III oxidase [Alphaproteobacteria bacterium]|nr:oxygen-independent coproporphyrinogen III oxidase [Alphaproteobacteria bacterium]